LIDSGLPGLARENYDPRLASLSVVAASYASGGAGPVRMDYDRVIPLVEYTARTLSRLMES
jgi:transcriptional regulator of heat shock response